MGQYPDGIAPGTLAAGEEHDPNEGVRTHRTKTVWTLREVLKTPYHLVYYGCQHYHGAWTWACGLSRRAAFN